MLIHTTCMYILSCQIFLLSLACRFRCFINFKMKVYCLLLFLCLASVVQILKESYPNVFVIIRLENTYISCVVEALVLNLGVAFL